MIYTASLRMLSMTLEKQPSFAARFTEARALPVSVLVVDDVEMDRELIEKKLAQWRCVVTTAGTKHDAERLAMGRDFDIAMVDMCLPWEGNGISVMKKLRARNPMIPICAFSGAFTGENVARICREVGPVATADKWEMVKDDRYLRQLFGLCQLARRAGMGG